MLLTTPCIIGGEILQTSITSIITAGDVCSQSLLKSIQHTETKINTAEESKLVLRVIATVTPAPTTSDTILAKIRRRNTTRADKSGGGSVSKPDP